MMMINSTQPVDLEIFVHSLNPFTNTIHSEVLSPQTMLFPDKTKNFHGLNLRVSQSSKSVDAFFNVIGHNLSLNRLSSEFNILMTQMLLDVLNCSKWLHYYEKYNSIQPEPRWQGVFADVILTSSDEPEFELSPAGPTFWYLHQMSQINVPRPLSWSLYVKRPKTYVRSISVAAMLTFGGLFFTAWMFAMWVYLLGFRETNWNFINILTAQMGGSIQHQGRMKLSEMIFQMNIDIATFIVVTLGSDYMFQIFILIENPPEMPSLQDLADSDIDLVSDFASMEKFVLLGRVVSPALGKIANRTRVGSVTPGTHSFCDGPSTKSSTLVEGMNICLTDDRFRQDVMKSNNDFSIERVPRTEFSF
ncbi:hypothetical protein QAD02_016907 [Eretmocerus hayati]|uniref:Uncharacterized protein n=1 Tax=Eretmocerus hayati TaxID=131215 RepID=A0ACC2PH82_9HYME|nr:hypothetical protein QAD02_016907 [Eretmocerus hayati]